MKASSQTPSWGWSFWLFSAVLIGIWQSQPEIESTLQEGGIDYTVYLGPIWVKLIKDFYVIALWGYLVLFVKDPFPEVVGRSVAGLYTIVALAFGLACVTLNPLLAAAGLRWIITAFVFLELRRLHGCRFNPSVLAAMLVILLAINISLQGARLFYFPPVWGERWGLSARVPGFFLLPNTNALFATSCAALVIDMLGRRHGLARFALALAALSALLSQSAGGLLACLVLTTYLVLGRLSHVIPLAALAGVIALMAAPTLLGRDEFLEYSGGERIEKFMSSTEELLGLGAFGAYTNTGFMLSISDELTGASTTIPVISDSFYVSLVGNFGLLTLPITLLFWRFMSRASRHIRQRGRRTGIACLLCLATFAFSTVITEAFPMNVMLAIGVWMGSAPAPQRKRTISRVQSVGLVPAQGAGAPS